MRQLGQHLVEFLRREDGPVAVEAEAGCGGQPLTHTFNGMKDAHLIRQANAASVFRDAQGRFVKPLTRRQFKRRQALIEIENAAREVLLKKHLPIIFRIAKRYNHRYPRMDFDELVQAGRLGLLHALPRFKEEKGYQFLTYAGHWIDNFIQTACRTQWLIWIPMYLQERGKQNQLSRQRHKEEARRAGRIRSLDLSHVYADGTD